MQVTRQTTTTNRWGEWALTLISRVLALMSLVYSLGSLFIYGFLPANVSLAFSLLGIENPAGGRMFPPFGDLRWVTALSACGVDLNDLANKTSQGCDPYGRGADLGYPPMSVLFARLLAVKGHHTGLLGFSIGLAVVVVLVLLSRRLVRPEWLANSLIALMLLGFPMQLGLERSNIDLVVFVLLCSLAAISQLPQQWASLPAAWLAWLAVAIKMYPLVGITAWVLNSRSAWRQRIWMPLAVLSGTGAGLAGVWSWYHQSGDLAAAPLDRDIGHGMRVPLTLLRPWLPQDYRLLEDPGQPLLALALTLLAFILLRRQGLHDQWKLFLQERASGFELGYLAAMPPLLALAWLGCYWFSGSFDYRLILVLPLLINACAMLSCNKGMSRWSRGFLALILLGVVYGWFAPFFAPLSMVRKLNVVCDLFAMPLFAGALLALLLEPLPRWPSIRASQALK